jgi:hypothetical protein
MKVFTVHGVFKIARFTDAPSISFPHISSLLSYCVSLTFCIQERYWVTVPKFPLLAASFIYFGTISLANKHSCSCNWKFNSEIV